MVSLADSDALCLHHHPCLDFRRPRRYSIGEGVMHIVSIFILLLVMTANFKCLGCGNTYKSMSTHSSCTAMAGDDSFDEQWLGPEDGEDEVLPGAWMAS